MYQNKIQLATIVEEKMEGEKLYFVQIWNKRLQFAVWRYLVCRAMLEKISFYKKDIGMSLYVPHIFINC